MSTGIIIALLVITLGGFLYHAYSSNRLQEKIEALENENKRLSEKMRSKLDKTENTLTTRLDELSTKLNQHIDSNEKSMVQLDEKIDTSQGEILKQTTNNTVYIANAIDNEIKDLRKKLEIFTEIDSDSKSLNENEDIAKQESLISKALSQITTQTHSADDDSIEPDKIIYDENFNKNSQTETLDDIIKQDATREDVVLDNEQLSAYSKLNETMDNFFITGKAGTGKSFLLKVFEQGTSKRILKVAPTGISALNIDGSTLHSAFGYDNLESLSLENMKKGLLRLNHDKELVLKHIDTLVIDEISMVRADIFDKINKILQLVNESDKLFGGKQVIIFGDLFQLPPIANKSEESYLNRKYGGIYFFNSDTYKNGNFHFIELRTNHRQEKDLEFFETLNRIREGSITQNDIDKINSRVVSDGDELRRIVHLFPKRADAELLNKQELSKIPAKEYTYHASIIQNKYNNQNIIIENYFPAVTNLTLKVGALVMLTKNDPQRRWVNGTLGIVSRLSDSSITITINGTPYEIYKERFETKEAIYSNGKIFYDTILEVSQFPIMLAYAITIHKSQGLTYQKIACDIVNCFSTGQAYVALSRCTTFSGLHLLKELSIDDIKVDAKVTKFYLSLKTKKEED